MARDDLFISLALRGRLLTQAKFDEATQLKGILAQNGFDLTLPEVMIKKGFLDAEQVRIINMAIRYEETRQDDLMTGEFISDKGFVAQEKISECLDSQEQPYREGRHFARLHDMLIQKGYLTPQQIHVILRARQQFESSRRTISSPALPVPRPSVPAPKGHAVKPNAASSKAIDAGLTLDTLKAGITRTKLKGTQAGDIFVQMLDLHGALDGHTFKEFDDYVTAVIDTKSPMLVLNCAKLDYVSSAGIGVVAGAAKRCRDRKGDVRLCQVPTGVLKVINMLGLNSILKIYVAEKDAVMSFKF